jgi:hypothetical protein
VKAEEEEEEPLLEREEEEEEAPAKPTKKEANKVPAGNSEGKSISAYTTELMLQGGNVEDILEKTKKYGEKRGSDCMSTMGKLRAHLKYVQKKYPNLSEVEGVFKLKK